MVLLQQICCILRRRHPWLYRVFSFPELKHLVKAFSYDILQFLTQCGHCFLNRKAHCTHHLKLFDLWPLLVANQSWQSFGVTWWPNEANRSNCTLMCWPREEAGQDSSVNTVHDTVARLLIFFDLCEFWFKLLCVLVTVAPWTAVCMNSQKRYHWILLYKSCSR